MRNMRNMMQSNNPALADAAVFNESYGHMTAARPTTATLSGVVNKTAILILIAAVAGAGGYSISQTMPSIMWISAIAAFVITLGVYFVLRGKPQLAPIAAPIYAVVEGVFLGSLTGMLDGYLVKMEAMRGLAAQAATEGKTIGLALPAFIITMSIMVAMLGLYKAKIIKPTKTFQAVISTMTVGIMITYLLSFLLSFGGISMPFLGIGSAMAGGTMGWIGIGINVLILGVASMWLIMDFKRVEDIVNSGQPRYMEWYAGFALLVTLAWIYYEAVKLCFLLAMMFGNRD